MLRNTGEKKDTGSKGRNSTLLPTLLQKMQYIIVEMQTFLQRLFILMIVKKAKFNSSHFKRKFGTNINDSENFFSLFLFPQLPRGL